MATHETPRPLLLAAAGGLLAASGVTLSGDGDGELSSARLGAGAAFGVLGIALGVRALRSRSAEAATVRPPSPSRLRLPAAPRSTLLRMSDWNGAFAAELVWPTEVGPGSRGAQVNRVQEWLSLQGLATPVDGGFGPTTQAQVRTFQQAQGLPVTGRVDGVTFAALSRPMALALAPFTFSPGTTLGEAALLVGRQHVAQHPREVGGANSGPWVRGYMAGHDGTPWAWCAGFAGTLVRQAAAQAGLSLAAPPFAWNPGVARTARAARAAGRFIRGEDARANPALLGRGAVFFLRKPNSTTDWHHTGLAFAPDASGVQSIEGNTNREGGREGVEARSRRRPWAGLDFARLDG